MATYIVGDIQGCYEPLKKLLDIVGFMPGQDKLWAVGDLIGRGPQSVETLEFLYQLEDSFDTVLGNHDLHFLAITQGLKKARASDKFGALLEHPDLNTFIHWLRHKPLAVRLQKHVLLSHAGLYPGWGFNTAIRCSDEASQVLQSERWVEMLANMYGNTPMAWSDDLLGHERLNFIINAFTRMRFLTKDAKLNLVAKGPAYNAPAELFPWFQFPKARIKSKQRVIFGHWAALEGQTHSPQFIALDTGRIWGGKMTLMRLDDNSYFAV